jgi:uncharacterized protein (TIGR01244 family)
MKHRAPSIIGLLTVLAAWPSASLVSADTEVDKPAAPKQIDETPPLIPIPGARVTKTGLLVGGQPSPEQLRAIQRAGYRTVINLRPPDERGTAGERAAVERLGMTFVSIPIRGAAGLIEDNARKLGAALDKPDALPAVVHCSTGQRASAMLGLEAFVVDRVSAAAAIEYAKTLGMKKHEEALRKRIAQICKADKSRHCEEVR